MSSICHRWMVQGPHTPAFHLTVYITTGLWAKETLENLIKSFLSFPASYWYVKATVLHRFNLNHIFSKMKPFFYYFITHRSAQLELIHPKRRWLPLIVKSSDESVKDIKMDWGRPFYGKQEQNGLVYVPQMYLTMEDTIFISCLTKCYW